MSLTSTQRLLKYPLLLEVLYKYTEDGHPDKANIRMAQDAMRVTIKASILPLFSSFMCHVQTIAVSVNKSMQKKEHVFKIQVNLEGWVGPQLGQVSSELIHEGDVMKVCL